MRRTSYERLQDVPVPFWMGEAKWWCVLCFAKLGGPRKPEPQVRVEGLRDGVLEVNWSPYTVPAGFEIWDAIPEDWFA